ncbi:MAG: hypothetical protein IID61_14580 [SAR324 cluster bacterium]|nr:hypothetical protein [SAR324 cluster bacterium]
MDAAIGRSTESGDKPIGVGLIEIGQEVSLASELHEIMKDRIPTLPEITVEWVVTVDVPPISDVEDELRQKHESILSNIDALLKINPKDLPEGSVLPTPATCEAAMTAVEALFHSRGLLFQHVAPLPDGGVELEFESPHLYIGLWVQDRDNIDVLVRMGQKEKSRNARIDQLSDTIWGQIA